VSRLLNSVRLLERQAAAFAIASNWRGLSLLEVESVFSSAQWATHHVLTPNPLTYIISFQGVTKWGEPASRVVCFSDIDNGKISNEQNQHWDWLFGVFYNKSPDFDNSNLATTLSGCMGLVDVAESVHAVDLVRPVVDLALLRQNNVLWTSIASNPIAWAELGRRVHSPTIFREGIIHVVGKWNTISAEDKAELHPDIREICQRKFNEIDIAKEVIELRILGHYPDFLCRNAVDRPGRPTYSADIYMWMAICFYRQWFAQAISDGRNRTSSDGGYEFYHQIGAGGQAYLNHESFKNFHQYFPMSSKACNVLEANMNIMKEDVKKFVTDILVNRSSIDPKTYPLHWLTCALIMPKDFPWSVTEENAEATGNPDIMEDLEPLTPIPRGPSTMKRRRPTDEYTNGYANGAGTLAGSSVNEGDFRAHDEH
jgi:hypothetical protein